MERDRLISEVKSEYARLADMESRESFQDLTTTVSPEAYYERLLDKVIADIGAGVYDNCRSGREVIEAVANNRAGKARGYSKLT